MFVYKKNCPWKKKFSEILKYEICTTWEKKRELKSYDLRKSQHKNQEKITRQFNCSLPNCSKLKNRRFLWMIMEFSKVWNQNVVEGCLTFPINMQWFRVLVLVPCLAATNHCRLIHRITLEYRKTFLEVNLLRLIHPEIILKEFNLTTCKETGKQSLKLERRRLVTQVKTDKNQGTIPVPTIATKPLTTSSTIRWNYDRTVKTAKSRNVIRQIPLSTIVFVLEDMIQESSECLFDFPSDAMK